jgi:hypothetical protein
MWDVGFVTKRTAQQGWTTTIMMNELVHVGPTDTLTVNNWLSFLVKSTMILDF